MNIENEAIFSSTGNLGVSRRQYNRLYVNGTRFSSDPSEVARNFMRLRAIGETHQERIGRVMFRGLVSEEVIHHVTSNGLHNNVEVALPVSEFTGDNSWLLYMSHNNPGREGIIPTDTMIHETEEYRRVADTPLQKIQAVIDHGYSFTDNFEETDVHQMLELWSGTFGWSEIEMHNLKRRILSQRGNSRNVWFSAIRKDGLIVSAAMAERLDIPASSGEFSLVESTEWRTRRGFEGQGLMTATLCMLNAQILSDFRNNGNSIPFIYSECNFQTRSDRAGHGAGLRIPDRTIQGYQAPQILIQNVLVNDGASVEPGKLRDFTFLYLPVDTIDRHYNPQETSRMMSILHRQENT